MEVPPAARAVAGLMANTSKTIRTDRFEQCNLEQFLVDIAVSREETLNPAVGIADTAENARRQQLTHRSDHASGRRQAYEQVDAISKFL